MDEIIFIDLAELNEIQRRVYRASVKVAAKRPPEELKNVIRNLVRQEQSRSREVILCASLDALRMSTAGEDFADFMTSF